MPKPIRIPILDDDGIARRFHRYDGKGSMRLTWSCPTPESARIMAAIFEGRYEESPRSRPRSTGGASVGARAGDGPVGATQDGIAELVAYGVPETAYVQAATRRVPSYTERARQRAARSLARIRLMDKLGGRLFDLA